MTMTVTQVNKQNDINVSACFLKTCFEFISTPSPNKKSATHVFTITFTNVRIVTIFGTQLCKRTLIILVIYYVTRHVYPLPGDVMLMSMK